MHILDGVILGFLLYYLTEEYKQITYGHKHFYIGLTLIHFTRDIWNILDVAILVRDRTEAAVRMTSKLIE